MSPLDEFKREADSIFEEYATQQITHAQAEIMLQGATDEMLMAYLTDTPDNILENAFHACARLQLEAYRQEDVTENEAIALIEQRAQDLFDKSRPPEEIENLWRAYDNKLEEIKKDGDNDHTGTQPPDDPHGYWGPFSLN